MGKPGWTEVLIVLLILVLLFGAKKLPELARGSGRALRIFKSETKGLMTDEDEDDDVSTPRPELSQSQPPASEVPPQPAPTSEPTQQRTETDR
jgi:sec-independent protein translocase protein TatA